MFTKPLSQTEYSDIETFCNAFSEGVRVEYKNEMIKEIPKAISAFANTLGGIIVIGAETDKAQNKVVAINGIDREIGIEERIINASINGIYPSVIPEVKIFEIPEKKNKILVVIKVHESLEAPHAIQNSTRVYIRTGSINQPYELAEIDRIEYFLKRREKPAKLKEELKQRARSRAERFASPLKLNKPCLYISISPVFPYKPLISLDELYGFCNSVEPGSPAYYYVNDPQRITDGICKFFIRTDGFLYREINHYGLVFTCDALNKVKSRWRAIGREEDERLYLGFNQFVLVMGKALKLAELFYKRCGYMGNLEVEVNIENIADEYLLYGDDAFSDLYEYKSIDDSTTSSEIIVVEDINSKFLDIVILLIRNILWTFNCRVTNSKPLIEKTLIANKLIMK